MTYHVTYKTPYLTDAVSIDTVKADSFQLGHAGIVIFFVVIDDPDIGKAQYNVAYYSDVLKVEKCQESE